MIKAGSIAVLATAVVLVGCAGGAPDESPFEAAKAAAADGDGIVLVDFFTDW